MNKEIEEIIVKSFFNKRIRQRVLFELSTQNKRRHALHRLCHNYFETLRNEYMIEIPKPNSDPQEIVKIMKKYGAEDSCYSISLNEDIDGKELPLLTAIEEAVGYGMPSIVSCIPGKLVYFETELVSGSPPRFILKR
ncbi:hypothetical protein [Neobacillus ginsengisoli]|uniref:Uncharacterized protein n=1 Tax=Neobacillus ginsengisoli TaxID=904295 RepID=A0ABT9Y2E4_9BACI|nr:hypothetical protein [Neobacillus ginsengisoli]MDQ0201977.1 hypothetical protein [Neobacillus ginsengisoli]